MQGEACRPSSPLPREISDLVDRGLFLLIYGPPATGKTRIAFEVAKYVLGKGGDAVVLATESGTATYARAVAACVPTRVVLDVEELLENVIYAASKGAFMVVDSINWIFRSAPTEKLLSVLSFISSVLKQVGGLAVGQVAEVEGETEMALGRWVIPWADVVGVTRRLGGEARGELEVLKPFRRVIAYELTAEGVRWLE